MRIEVKTCNDVRIMLDTSLIKSQRRIIIGEDIHTQVTLTTGKTLDLKLPIFDFPLEPDIDISKKSKFLKRLTQKFEIVTDSK
jgi:hypothetical protein